MRTSNFNVMHKRPSWLWSTLKTFDHGCKVGVRVGVLGAVAGEDTRSPRHLSCLAKCILAVRTREMTACSGGSQSKSCARNTIMKNVRYYGAAISAYTGFSTVGLG